MRIDLHMPAYRRYNQKDMQSPPFIITYEFTTSCGKDLIISLVASLASLLI